MQFLDRLLFCLQGCQRLSYHLTVSPGDQLIFQIDVKPCVTGLGNRVLTSSSNLSYDNKASAPHTWRALSQAPLAVVDAWDLQVSSILNIQFKSNDSRR